MDIVGAVEHAVSRLSGELSDKLLYHCVRHSVDVMRFSEVLALAEGVRGDDLVLVQTAAIYHDIGFLSRYQKNEPVACEICVEALPGFDYNTSQIDKICEMILATQVPQSPKDILGEVLCDADLDYLGTPDFDYWSEKLRQEMSNYGTDFTDIEWIELEVRFLEMHDYFTASAKLLRNETKARHLAKLKTSLAGIRHSQN